MRLFEFDQYTGNDLHRVYLFSHSDRFSFSHIDSLVRSVAQKMFEMLTPPGIFPESIDRNCPVFNYGNRKELANLIAKNVIDRNNVYNQPENLINANSKTKFHQILSTLDFIPKTVFTKEEAAALKFPVIAKTDKGSKGEGVKVFKTAADLASSEDVFQVFSEKFDLDKEFRCLALKGKVIFIAERIPMNDKANSLREGQDIFDRNGTLDDRSSYQWETVEMGQNGLPAREQFEELCQKVNTGLGLEFLGIDIGIDKSGKLFCIEANTCPGLNKDQIVTVYESVFEDFFKRKPSANSQKQLDQFRAELLRANADPAKFSHSAHMGRKFYAYKRETDPDHGTADGKPTMYTVKFDLEKSFGKPLKDIKKMQHIKEFQTWTSTGTEPVKANYDYLPTDRSTRTYYGMHKVSMQYSDGSPLETDAKFDTGAAHTSISLELAKRIGVPENILAACEDIERSGTDRATAKELSKKYGLTVKRVKSASGVTLRAYIPITISFDGRTLTTTANVIDRSGLKATALIGLADMN